MTSQKAIFSTERQESCKEAGRTGEVGMKERGRRSRRKGEGGMKERGRSRRNEGEGKEE